MAPEETVELDFTEILFRKASRRQLEAIAKAAIKYVVLNNDPFGKGIGLGELTGLSKPKGDRQ